MTARLAGRSAFGALRREGRRARSGLVTVTARADAGSDPPRVAYAVGRSVGPAVVRNRVRRRLRAICAELAAAKGLPPGDYLIGVAQGGSEASYDELKAMVGKAVTVLSKETT